MKRHMVFCAGLSALATAACGAEASNDLDTALSTMGGNVDEQRLAVTYVGTSGIWESVGFEGTYTVNAGNLADWDYSEQWGRQAVWLVQNWLLFTVEMQDTEKIDWFVVGEAEGSWAGYVAGDSESTEGIRQLTTEDLAAREPVTVDGGISYSAGDLAVGEDVADSLGERDDYAAITTCLDGAHVVHIAPSQDGRLAAFVIEVGADDSSRWMCLHDPEEPRAFLDGVSAEEPGELGEVRVDGNVARVELVVGEGDAADGPPEFYYLHLLTSTGWPLG